MEGLETDATCSKALSILFLIVDVWFFCPPAYRKHVTWLLGRDGDVSVSVIGELDEFRSCKILQSLMNR